MQLIPNHDPEKVESFCYSDVKGGDELTARFRNWAHGWRDSAGWSDSELAERIRADQIDILVDLALHTDGNRLQVFARKPAPVQATWLGYPGTTGLKSIDYRLTDRYIDPPGEGDEFYTSDRFGCRTVSGVMVAMNPRWMWDRCRRCRPDM